MRKENILIKIIRIVLLIILSPIVLIYVVIGGIKRIKKRKIDREKVKICTISQINILSGIQFEEFLKELFLKLGYRVKLTKRSKDYGVDLILEKDKKKYIVQAKRYSHTVGVHAVQEIVTAREHYKIYNAIVVTNNEFSKEAQILAIENDVKLCGGQVLEKLINKFDIKIELSYLKEKYLTQSEKEEIEKKYRFWI